ncbi:MAG: hypothetical protein WBQ89_17875 [Candidatus Acidiferrum sp.]
MKIEANFRVLVIVFSVAWAALVPAQVQSQDAEGHAWWQHALNYEGYPRSFADSNGMG